MSISSSNINPREARAGDVVTLSFTANETIQTPAVLIDGRSVVAAAGGSGNSWTAAATVTAAFPQGPVVFSIVATDPSNNTAAPVTSSSDGSGVTVDTVPPVIDTAGVPRTIYLAGSELPDLTGLVLATDATAAGSVPLTPTQSPAPGTPLIPGQTTVTFSATDAAGNSTQAAVAILFSTSDIGAVASRAGHPPGQIASAQYTAFGAPQTGPFGGSLSVGGAKIPAIFAADGSVLVQAGGPPPGDATAMIASLGQPNGGAVLARLKMGAGGIVSQDSTVLLAGLDSGSPRVAAQTGVVETGLPAGVSIRKILSFDGQGADVFFLADLQGPGISASQSLALCVAPAAGGVKILASKGEAVNGKTISILGSLVGSKGTLAASRWRVGDSAIGLRLTFTDQSEAICIIPTSAAAPADWTILAQTGPVTGIAALAGASISSFGLPGFGPDGFVVVANLTNVNSSGNAALLAGAPGALRLLAQKGVSQSGFVVQRFGDPLAGASSGAACLATLAGNHLPGGGACILYTADGVTVQALASAGAAAAWGRDTGRAFRRSSSLPIWAAARSFWRL